MISAKDAVKLGNDHNRERTFFDRHKGFMEALEKAVIKESKSETGNNYLKIIVSRTEFDKEDFAILIKFLSSKEMNYSIRTLDPSEPDLGFEMRWGC